MRKLALALAVLLAAALPGISGADQPDAVREEEAFATWSVPSGRPNHFTWYFAYGFREIRAQRGSFTVAGVGKGHCVRRQKKRFVDVTCSGYGGDYSRDPQSFRMSQTASSARISFAKDGRRFLADWAEADPPRTGFYTTQIGCNGAGGGGGGILWEPDASGRMYGEKLTRTRWWDFSMTLSGAYVMDCGQRLVDRLLAGKSIEMTFKR